MTFWDWVYRYFEGLGKKILTIYPNLPDDIRKSGIHLYPEVYASFMVFMTILISVLTIGLSIVFAYIGLYLAIPIVIPIPFLVLILLAYTPALIGSSRAGGIEGEFPYTTAYLSMMVMSGLSPYIAFERITHASRVFTKSAELSQRFILLVRVLGRDPLTAFSLLAQRTPSATVRDLLMGYITTVRAGGDVVDYLNKKARLLFSEILVKMKIIADRLSSLLEAYLALVLLSLISLTVMYFVTVAFSTLSFGISPAAMFLTLYILIPMISGMIIYLADITQYKEPWIDYRPYLVFGGLSIPLTIYLILFGIVFPSILPPYNPLKQSFLVMGLYNFLIAPAKAFNIDTYLYPSVAFSMALIIATLPAAIYTEIISREYKIISGITRFLRDLVEIRKTGLSPERSIIELSRRNYGVFTKYLRRIAMQLSLGIPLSRIINDLFKKIIVWRAKVLLFVLTDTIEVGGGTVEIMENLAWFAESVDAIEDERKKNLRTLLIVPYMGAILSTATVIMLAVFLGSMPLSVGAYAAAAAVTMPSIVLNVYLMGLVAGKVSSGSIAAGFKHALILTLITLLFLIASPLFRITLGGLTQPVT
jgi:flagellar protein FlaJ